MNCPPANWRTNTRRWTAIACSPDEILVTSGSLQGLDLVNSLLLAPAVVQRLIKRWLNSQAPDDVLPPALALALSEIGLR